MTVCAGRMVILPLFLGLLGAGICIARDDAREEKPRSPVWGIRALPATSWGRRDIIGPSPHPFAMMDEMRHQRELGVSRKSPGGTSRPVVNVKVMLSGNPGILWDEWKHLDFYKSMSADGDYKVVRRVRREKTGDEDQLPFYSRTGESWTLSFLDGNTPEGRRSFYRVEFSDARGRVLARSGYASAVLLPRPSIEIDCRGNHPKLTASDFPSNVDGLVQPVTYVVTAHGLSVMGGTGTKMELGRFPADRNLIDLPSLSWDIFSAFSNVRVHPDVLILPRIASLICPSSGCWKSLAKRPIVFPRKTVGSMRMFPGKR